MRVNFFVELCCCCQVAVIQNGKVLVDTAAGARDPYSLAPVQSDSVFNVFSVTKAVAATAVHILAQVFCIGACVCVYVCLLVCISLSWFVSSLQGVT